MIDILDDENVVQLSVQLCRSLSGLADPGTDMHSRVRRAIHESAASSMSRFGIPGSPNVTLTATGSEVGDGGRVLRLSIAGRTVRYPDEMLQQAWCYTTGQLVDPEVTPALIQSRLLKGASTTDPDDELQIVRFLSLVCEKIVDSEPASLLGPPQCRNYASALGDAGAHIDLDWLLGVLRRVLDLRISIADHSLVASVLEASRTDQAATLESLISALRRDTVDILADKPTLCQLTTNLPADLSTMFPFLREGLFDELGVPMPAFRFGIVDDQRPGSFAFRVNDFVSVPLLALQPNQLMVNDTSERLRVAGFADAIPITSPATGQPNGLIDVSNERQAQDNDLTTWTQSGHLLLAFAEFLRTFGWCTIHRGVVQRQLGLVEAVFPRLVQAAGSWHSHDELTDVLRALARDRVSIQNLPAILESLLDFDLSSGAHPGDGSGASSSHPDLIVQARIALGPAIAHRAARSTDTVVVYLLDPDIERIIAESAPFLDETQADAILDALRAEMAYLPPTAQVPNILTSTAIRAKVRRLVATEHPRLAVLAYDELPPGRNVQPIARVSL